MGEVCQAVALDALGNSDIPHWLMIVNRLSSATRTLVCARNSLQTGFRPTASVAAGLAQHPVAQIMPNLGRFSVRAALEQLLDGTPVGDAGIQSHQAVVVRLVHEAAVHEPVCGGIEVVRFANSGGNCNPAGSEASFTVCSVIIGFPIARNEYSSSRRGVRPNAHATCRVVINVGREPILYFRAIRRSRA